jgi:hypothetical protein
MESIKDIMQAKIKPKEKQVKLVELIVSCRIPVNEFIIFFESADDF